MTASLAERLAAATGSRPWWPLVEPTARWVRVRLDGHLVADSRRALLVVDYGPAVLPTYYLPLADVVPGSLAAPTERADGTVTWTVRAGGRSVTAGARSSGHDRARFPELEGYVTFSWHELEWYEEDERVVAHARDPHKRVDVVTSSRHVEVAIEGVTVADSRQPLLVFETMLPTRCYLPRRDVRMDLLVPSETSTVCPYKGVASYWSVDLGNHRVADVAWSYATPIAENPRIRDLVCFFDERVDVTIDGIPQPRPQTPWS